MSATIAPAIRSIPQPLLLTEQGITDTYCCSFPVFHEQTLEEGTDRLLRSQGAAPDLLRTRSARSVAAAQRAWTEGQALLRPNVALRDLAVSALRHERLRLFGGGVLSGPLVARHLAPAERVILLVCTIGPELEKQASRSISDDPAFAFFLDVLGSLAVGDLASAACTHIAAMSRPMQTTVPLGPGLEGWPLDPGQLEIFDLLDASRIGVTLTSSSQMIPRMSTSLVVGIGSQVTATGCPCDFCNMRLTCRHKDVYKEKM